jgi:hypothetical protein
MLYLFKALARKFQFAVRCLLGLLNERVKDDDALADKKAVKRSTDPGASARPQLEQAFAEGS